MPEFFPGTSDPLPPLLTPIEAVKVLRLDVITSKDGELKPRAPGDALKSLRRLPLTPRRFSKSNTYCRDDVLRLIATATPSKETDE